MIITRFAPSPTGYLHIGGLRTALFNFLYAKANNGKFLLRIEDTDFSRNNKEATDAIIEAFSWVGLSYDNEIVYQSQRLEIYKEYAQKLIESNQAYYCYMSKDELEDLREKAKKEGKIYKYDNRYRDFQGEIPKDIKPVIRIKSPLEGKICFNDALKGKIEIDAKELDDYVIMRSDGTPTYNFVVAIDDALMGVSDVIRGDDHLTNTPKQIIVYQALGFKVPRFCHIPMILNDKGQKLSKRDGATNVMDYKDLGILPCALLNFLLRLGFSHKDKEIFSLKESLALFNLENLSSSPSSYNLSKLFWLNHHYLLELSQEDLDKLLQKNIPLDADKKEVLYKEVKERSNTLIEFQALLDDVLLAPKSYDNTMIKKLDSAIAGKLLEIFDDIDFDDIEKTLKESIIQKNLPLGKVMAALRLSLLGKSGGIGINETLFILGKEESKKRVESFVKKYNTNLL